MSIFTGFSTHRKAASWPFLSSLLLLAIMMALPDVLGAVERTAPSLHTINDDLMSTSAETVQGASGSLYGMIGQPVTGFSTFSTTHEVSHGLPAPPDLLPPELSIASPSLTWINSTLAVDFQILYTDAATITLSESDVLINHNGTSGGSATISGIGTEERTVTILGVTGDGSFTISIAADTAADLSGNLALTAGPSDPVQVDNTPPTATMIGPVYTKDTTPTLTFTLSDPQVGGVASGVDSMSATVNGVEYTGTETFPGEYQIQVTESLANGDYVVAAEVTDLIGNTGSYPSSGALTIDTQAPIVLTSTPADGERVQSLTRFELTFDEPVSGVIATDLSISGGVTVTGYTPPGASLSAGPYRWNFTAPSTDEVTITLASSAILDEASNSFEGALFTVRIDQDAPTLESITPTDGAAINALTTLTLSFSEPVFNLLPESLLVNASPIATGLTGSDSGPYIFTIPQPANGIVNLSLATGSTPISDEAGNEFTGASWSYDLNSTPPEIEVGTLIPAQDAVLTELTEVEVSFTKSVQHVALSSLEVNGVATAIALSGVGSGPYTFTIPQPGDGPISLSIVPGTPPIEDTAHGNLFTGFTWDCDLDAQAPLVLETSPVAQSRHTSLTEVSVTFTESVQGVNQEDLLVNGNAIATALTGSGAGPYSFSFPEPEEGELSISLISGSPQTADVSGNPFEGPYDWTLYLDGTAPQIAAKTPAPGAILPSVDSVSVLFDEPVENVALESLLVNGASTATIVSGSGAGPYLFTIPQPDWGTITLSLDPGAIQDTFGNPYIGESWSFQLNQPPTVTSMTPTEGSVLTSLETVEIHFSEAVINLSVGDLLINGEAIATALSGADAGPYLFSLPALDDGVISLSLSAGSITDLFGIPYAGGDAWTINLNAKPLRIVTDLPTEFSMANHQESQLTIEVTDAFGPVTYEWYFKKEGSADFVSLDSHGQSLPFDPADYEDAGYYYCQASDAYDAVVSEICFVQVHAGVPVLGGFGLSLLATGLLSGALLSLRRRKK